MKRLNLTTILCTTIALLFLTTGFAFACDLWGTSGNNIYYNSGKVGIGDSSPSKTLTVAGDAKVGGAFFIKSDGKISGNATTFKLLAKAGRTLQLGTDNTNGRLFIDTSGNVGIGTITPQSELAVNGKITAQEVQVTQTGWSDFVFEDGYNLASLDKVESYIKENGHLPDIPSAKQIKEDGLAVSEMLAKQMQKIEEMTLYLIEMKKENEELKARMAVLETLSN